MTSIERSEFGEVLALVVWAAEPAQMFDERRALGLGRGPALLTISSGILFRISRLFQLSS